VIALIADATTVLPVISLPAFVGRENDAGWRS
jgi:hypothetical protein